MSTKAGAGVPELAPHLKAVLRFEAKHVGLTDAALTPLVRQAFGLSVLRYRQRLLYAINAPGAEAVEPATVRRLKAVLTARQQRHSVGRLPAPRGV